MKSKADLNGKAMAVSMFSRQIYVPGCRHEGADDIKLEYQSS